MNHMLEALKQRRGKGVTLNITIEPQDDKTSDLAPSGMKKGMVGEDVDQEALQEGSPEVEVMGSDMEENPMMDPKYGMDEMDQGLESEMSDHERGHLMNGKPKSLGERARFEALSRVKGKK